MSGSKLYGKDGSLRVSNVNAGAAVTLTRTNDANPYTANDVVGAATASTAALTFAIGEGPGEYQITSTTLLINSTAIISGETTYRLALYNITPPSALGDNVAFDIPTGDQASFLGFVELGSPVDEGSTLYVEKQNYNKQITLLSDNVYGYLITVGAHTPAAQRVYVVTLHAIKV